MAQKHELVPPKDAEFDEFFEHYYHYVELKTAGNLPKSQRLLGLEFA
jgi:hypothetical protein